MLSFKDFVTFYDKHKKCPNDAGRRRSQPMNVKQLKTRYAQYLKSNEQKGFKKDELWEEVRSFVFQRDHYTCRLSRTLSAVETNELQRLAGHFYETLDPAHVFSRSAFPKLKYDPDNIVLLNRYSHSMLDTHKHPITGETLTVEQLKAWWIRILGREKYTFLLQKS